jgi:sec-independent protein translocase protein TatC
MALVPFPGGATPARYEEPDDEVEPDGEDGATAKMSFLEHLDELRKRLLMSILSIGVGFVIALIFIDRVFAFIMVPLQATLPDGRKMIYTEPTEAFMLRLKVAALVGLIIAAPAIMWQLWLFIAPGLYRREKRLALPFVISSSLLFVSGAAFNHYIVFPVAFDFLGSFDTEYMEFLPRIEPVFSLYARMLLALGLVFQMPVLVFTLARLGLITARFMIRNIKYAVLVIFIVAAVVTPSSDIVNQTLMAAPMLVLYLISIGIAWMVAPRNSVRD